jgi:hypothetical protein
MRNAAAQWWMWSSDNGKGGTRGRGQGESYRHEHQECFGPASSAALVAVVLAARHACKVGEWG